jgi:hypothetical protein
MKFGWAPRLPIALLILVSACLVSCGDDPASTPRTGEVVAWVYWDGAGLEGKPVEILETGESRTTDADGLARFRLAPGTYTLRAYGINRPGPPPAYVDFQVTVRAGEETRLEILDCLPCV